MRFLIGLILLAFPFAEIFLLVELAHRYGWWLLLYLVVIGLLGLQLIKGEKLLLSAKMMQNVTSGGNPIKTMLGSARNMVAGVLLIIPGVLSDVFAVILLLIPIQNSKPSTSGATNSTTNHQQTDQTIFNQSGFKQSGFKSKSNSKAANDDVIEGEFVEIKEDFDKNPRK
ncbi:MAG: FxsA family protein [Bdellovibrio sp.]|nr:FxsA family protein [Methylotenera sp.]